jgi:hypothetical protein
MNKKISDDEKRFSKWLSEKSGELNAREHENMHEAISHIKGLHTNKSESELCIKGRIWILQNLGPMRYHAWFHEISLSYEGGDRLTYHGSPFMTNTTMQRYGSALNVDKYKDVDIKHFLNSTENYF